MMPKIAILLSTYNGAPYLQEQLDSLFSQTYSNCEVIARDDGSSDATLEILKNNPLTLMETTENLGARGSFSALLAYAVEHTDADYFMFCDQDDVWYPNKVDITFQKMRELESTPQTPVLVHTDLEVVDETLQPIATSFWKYEYTLPQYNGFNRLLIQNTITGCTTMVNRTLATKAFPMPKDAIMHDWWLGLVASKFGKVGYSKEATIQYRQHFNNTIGAKQNRKSFFRDVKEVFFTLLQYILGHRTEHYLQDMVININQAKDFLACYRSELDAKSIDMLERLSAFRTLSFYQKRVAIFKYGLYKQGFMRNVIHWVKL
jgi:glycosyltransferase involved in cell wall biosynthesis